MIERNDNHVEEARRLLIGQYRGKKNIQAFLASYVRPLQDVENVLWDIVDAFMLDNAVGAQLDTLGRLVGEQRRGRSNEEFRIGIRIKIRVNRSKGRIVDIIDVASLANAPRVPAVEEHRYLNFHVETYGQTGERFLADYLNKTRAASSYGCLVASNLSTGFLALFDDAANLDGDLETFADVSGEGRLACACYGLPAPRTGGALVSVAGVSLLSEEGETMLSESGEELTTES